MTKGVIEQAHAGNWLVFVDTTILLQVYQSNHSSTIKAFDELTDHLDSVITTGQVRDEFLRNRSRLMTMESDALRNSKPKPMLPPYLRATDEGKTLSDAADKYCSTVDAMLAKIADQMRFPKRDGAYDAVRKLTDKPRDARMDDSADEHKEMFRRAEIRARLGRPPGKDDKSSIGDAYNWEWSLEACRRADASLLVVTLDGDYGKPDKSREILPNLALHDEFRRTVGKDRILRITQRLTLALETLGRKTTNDVVQAETEELLELFPMER